jgi:hypothetical protein
MAAVAMAGSSTNAIAGAGDVTTTVTPLSQQVTYSRAASGRNPALTTYVGYTVSIGNAPTNTNTINNIRFTGTATTTDTDEQLVFSSADGATCTTTNAQGTAIECQIGQLRAGQQFPTFAIFFVAPQKDTVSPLPDGNLADCTNTDCAKFSGITYYAEGTGGLPNSVPQNSTVNWTADNVALGTSNPILVKSALPKSGGTLYTGDGGVPAPSNKFTSLVTSPSYTTYTTAQIAISNATSINCTSLGNFNNCYGSDVTIPGLAFAAGSGKYLTIVLRIDASNIKAGTKINNVLVQYTDSSNNTQNVGDCASPTTPRSDGIPCIAKRIYYKNRGTQGWTPDLDGDFEFQLINLNNGRYDLF